MKYRELIEALKELNEDELEMTATIYSKNDDTYFIVEFTDRQEDHTLLLNNDVIERDHPIMIVNDKCC